MPRTYAEAFMPASMPCAAASSYPLVPFICPAKNSPSTRLDMRLGNSSRASIHSYSIAYASRTTDTFSKPIIERYISRCTRGGSDVDMP